MLGVEAIELVVHPMTHPIPPGSTEVMPSGHLGELRGGAGIQYPFALAGLTIRCQRVGDVEAVAGGAYRRASRAGQTAAPQLLPEIIRMECIHQHGDLLDVRDILRERLLALTGQSAEFPPVLIGGFADIARSLKDIRRLHAADGYQIAPT